MDIKLTIYGCRGLKDVQTLGTQDPYVYVQYGKTSFKTKTVNDGGITCGIFIISGFSMEPRFFSNSQ